MNISPEERVNMSLDELIKAKKPTEKKAVANKKGKRTSKSTGAPQTPSQGAKNILTSVKGRRTQRKSTNKNVAKVIGAGKAKREAITNQRRGLNKTGKATIGEIEKQVRKIAAKTPGGIAGTIGQKKRRSLPVGAAPIAKAGLKISFKAAEINQTTDKSVIQQIKGALSKSNDRKPAASAGVVTSSRTVSTGGRRVKK